VAQANQQIRSAIDRNDPKEPRRNIEQMKKTVQSPPQDGPGMMFDMDDASAVRDAFTKRRELDLRYAGAVADLLTPEQREKLPKPPQHKVGEPIIIQRTAGDAPQ
jgi:hypothetical protein